MPELRPHTILFGLPNRRRQYCAALPSRWSREHRRKAKQPAGARQRRRLSLFDEWSEFPRLPNGPIGGTKAHFENESRPWRFLRSNGQRQGPRVWILPTTLQQPRSVLLRRLPLRTYRARRWIYQCTAGGCATRGPTACGCEVLEAIRSQLLE